MTGNYGLIGALVAIIAVLAVLWAVARRGQRVSLSERDSGTPTLARRREAAPAPSAPALGDSELTRLKGVGPRLAARLNDLGVTRLDQVATWSDADLAAIDAQLGSFAGRPARDRWVEQARLLGAGDPAAYEAAFGRIDRAEG